MANQINALRMNALRAGQQVTDKDSSAPTDVVIAIGEQELSRDIEELENVLGQLDGKLSLLNATVLIEV